MKPYDICVITAANSHQAKGYRKQLEWRKDQGFLPDVLLSFDPAYSEYLER